MQYSDFPSIILYGITNTCIGALKILPPLSASNLEFSKILNQKQLAIYYLLLRQNTFLFVRKHFYPHLK